MLCPHCNKEIVHIRAHCPNTPGNTCGAIVHQSCGGTVDPRNASKAPSGH